jgi:hypothetical protein
MVVFFRLAEKKLCFVFNADTHTVYRMTNKTGMVDELHTETSAPLPESSSSRSTRAHCTVLSAQCTVHTLPAHRCRTPLPPVHLVDGSSPELLRSDMDGSYDSTITCSSYVLCWDLDSGWGSTSVSSPGPIPPKSS